MPLVILPGKSGVVFGFMSHIDRSFDPEKKRLPDIGDIRAQPRGFRPLHKSLLLA
ncbi:hypothetical protein [Sinorhizobium meliloti]|uniref:hypothetical protein n=1 Tax=Rhizobium meliloti TaxID=382 RepID=UPI003F5CEEF1